MASSQEAWLCRHQKSKPLRISMKQEMTEWQ